MSIELIKSALPERHRRHDIELPSPPPPSLATALANRTRPKMGIKCRCSNTHSIRTMFPRLLGPRFTQPRMAAGEYALAKFSYHLLCLFRYFYEFGLMTTPKSSGERFYFLSWSEIYGHKALYLRASATKRFIPLRDQSASAPARVVNSVPNEDYNHLNLNYCSAPRGKLNEPSSSFYYDFCDKKNNLNLCFE